MADGTDATRGRWLPGRWLRVAKRMERKLNREDLEAVVSIAQRFHDRHPDWPEAKRLLALALYDRAATRDDGFEDIVEPLRDAHRLDWEVLRRYMRTLFKLNRLDAALAVADEIDENRPALWPEATYWRAEIAIERDDLTEASRCTDRLLAASELDPDIAWNTAFLLLRMEDDAKARRVLENAATRWPHAWKPRMGLAVMREASQPGSASQDLAEGRRVFGGPEYMFEQELESFRTFYRQVPHHG